MPLDRPSCYRALTARDARFDGVFFVGVTSTRIYCRPVCRAKTPREGNCRFFSNPAAAERAGFRPCLRCRPELAPGNAPVDAGAVLAERATRAIAAGALNGSSVEALAASLGVTGRHLRRSVVQHLGVSPIELATTHRLLLAKRLLHETALPVGQVAFAAGFDSLRRFNAAFRARYRLTPATLRREAEATTGDRVGVVGGAARRPTRGSDRAAEGVTPRRASGKASTSHQPLATEDGAAAAAPDADEVVLTLDYRPPLHWRALLDFLAARAAPGAESVSEGRYAATVMLPIALSTDDTVPLPVGGTVSVTGHVVVELRERDERRARRSATAAAGPARDGLIVARISSSLVPALMPLLARLRDLLDLDANPDVIARHLVRAGVVPTVADFAGVRIPGTLDGFALAVRAILGQQVSVRGATTVMGRLVERFGEPYASTQPSLTRLMPTAEGLARLTTADIATLGMPGARADAVLALARAVASGGLSLASGGDIGRTIKALTALPGIGDWTAHYIAMRALRWPDAFPANDLVLRRVAGNLTAAQLLKRAESWRPWRAYAAMHLWRSAADPSPSRS